MWAGMDSILHKLILAVLLICLCAVLAVIWYCLFGTAGQGAVDGTLVLGPCRLSGIGGGVCL